MEQFDLKKKLLRNFLIGAIIFGFISLFLYLGGWKLIMELLSASHNDDSAITNFFNFLIIAPIIINVILVFWKYNRWTGKQINIQEQRKVAYLTIFNAYLILAIGLCSSSLFKVIAPHHYSTKETIQAINEDEYEDIGETVVYQTLLSDKNELYDEPTSGYHLFMKSHGGEDFYYLGRDYKGSKKNLLEKGSWTKKGMHFNARYYYSSFYFYTNVSAWSSSGSNSGGSSTRVIHEDGPRAVQEWVPCPVCANTGRVGLCQHCGGTGQDLYYTRDYRDCPNCGGLKKCTGCGGNGGHYETRYR